MNTVLYRLNFTTGVHFGEGTLGGSGGAPAADTLFSALCHEALAQGGPAAIRQLVEWVRAGRLCFSDLFPFSGQTLFLPKPLRPVAHTGQGDSAQKKLFKKLRYIPADQWQTYLQGKLDPAAAVEQLNRLGKTEVRTRIAARAPEKLESGDALPYSVGVYRFCAGCGLYLLLRYADEEAKALFDSLLNALAYSGLGGKRSSGLGRFTVEPGALPAGFPADAPAPGTPCLTLAVCMAGPAELAGALAGAQYLLMRRGGFVASDTYAAQPHRKRDFYAFRAGSCFDAPFAGDVFDVAGSGAHPVYRYAVPFLIRM